jgi:antitoxin HicB
LNKSKLVEHMRQPVPLIFTSQPEGGFTVITPLLPELVTEGDTLEQASRNVEDALEAVREIYAGDGRLFPVVG